MLMTFCGVNVPVSYWPKGVQVVANLLPLTHSLQAIRLILAEAQPGVILEKIALALLVSAVWLSASVLLMDRAAESGRRDGSIELV
jgi:ABC-2 type transport system permease protein